MNRQLRKEARESTKGLLADAKQISDVPNDPELWDKAKGQFFNEVGGQTDDLLLEGAAQAERLGLAIDFELVNQDVLNYAGTYKNEWWNRLQGATQRGMRTAIQTHIETGAPLRQLEKNLEPLFGKTRAQVIASTETTRMFAEGNKLAYKSAGVEQVQFQTVKDTLVDPDCKAAGKGGAKGDGIYPINAAPEPPLHPNCRCWIAPITGEGEILNRPVEQPIPLSDPLEWTAKNYRDEFTKRFGYDLERSVKLRDAQFITEVLDKVPTRVAPIESFGTRILTFAKVPHKDLQYGLEKAGGLGKHGAAGRYQPISHRISLSADYMPGGTSFGKTGRFGWRPYTPREPNPWDFSREIIAHEHGHAAVRARFGIIDPNDIVARLLLNNPISDYAKTNRAEFLAEAIAGMASDPTQFARQWPKVAKWLKDNGLV